jgi:hypothetical protein
MPGYIGAPADSTAWAVLTRPPASWTFGPGAPVVVGPVYFLYGGASVWVLVR